MLHNNSQDVDRMKGNIKSLNYFHPKYVMIYAIKMKVFNLVDTYSIYAFQVNRISINTPGHLMLSV